MNSVFESKEYCCGCTACLSICPQKAITMEYDICGFSYPSINQKKCVDCELCKKCCSFRKDNKYEKFMDCYVVKHISQEVVDESRSGGFFTALSDEILKNGGVVYGAFLDDNFFVRHKRATNYEQRDMLRKSKYVQSNLEGIYDNIALDLCQGKKVLFSGTGCQCDGLRGYLDSKSISYENLLICDLVCHSNASPMLFKKYLNYQSHRFHLKIKEYYFRDKGKYTWMDHVEKIVFENDKVYYTDEYTNLFYTDDIRPSCYNCKYTSLNRSGDFTLADCWGGQKIYPEIVNEKGASLVLVNTEKGKKYLEKIKSDIIIKPIKIEEVMQPRFQGPEEKSMKYDRFWSDYQNLDFAKFMKKYSKNNYEKKYILIKNIRKITKLPFRGIKKLLGELCYDVRK